MSGKIILPGSEPESSLRDHYLVYWTPKHSLTHEGIAPEARGVNVVEVHAPSGATERHVRSTTIQLIRNKHKIEPMITGVETS